MERSRGFLQSKEDVLSFIVSYLGREMPSTVLHTWFDDAQVLSLENSRITLLTTAEFKRDVIAGRYAPLIQAALFELFGTPFDVDVVLESLPEPPKASQPSDRTEFIFDRFVVGDSNKFAAAAARAVAESPGHAYNPLFIYGGSGLGKTHLLYAIMNHIRKTHPEFLIRDFSAEAFTNDLVSALQEKRTAEFHEKYRMANLLLVDDIQFIGGRNFSQEEFFHTFNTLYEANHQIVLTSDRPPKDMPALEERLRTRFECGLIVDIQPPDFETRMAIVKSKAARLGLLLSDDVTIYLATVITANVRQLEGSVKKMAAFRDLMNNSIDLEMAERAISDLLKENPGLNPTPSMIITQVASFYGIEERDILGKNRQADVANARQVCMYLTRSLTSMSYKDIGVKVFRRDHSTVMYAVEKVEEQRASDSQFNKTIQLLMENIRGQ